MSRAIGVSNEERCRTPRCSLGKFAPTRIRAAFGESSRRPFKPPGRLVHGAVHFFATAAKGTEPALRDELRELRFRRVKADRGGVAFEGELSEGYRACLWSRVAVRILAELGRFPAPHGDALYEGARAIDVTPFLSPDRTLAVRASSKHSSLTHTQFLAQRTKDALVDVQRERFGERPSVNVEDPDVGFFLHVVRDEATLYVDLAGDALHMRGYRVGKGEAPIKETLAAAILRLSGWTPGLPLVDPTCGSGTFPIEAALAAENRAPGLLRPRFGFERWKSFGDAERVEWRRLRAEAEAAVKPPTEAQRGLILGYDADAFVLASAAKNAETAGVQVRFEQRSMRDVPHQKRPTVVVTNPPYGTRLTRTLDTLRDINTLDDRCKDVRLVMIAGDPSLERAVRRKAVWRHQLFNGALDCRLLVWDTQR
jgi:23S rRNA G2445 N2-methylase RlmL